MPASSIESLMSWGVYLLASGGLVIALMPALAAVNNSSSSAAANNELTGIVEVLDSLRPGMVATFSVGSIGLTLGGHNVSLAGPSGTMTETCVWLVPAVNLAPLLTYSARLDGDTVSVLAHGPG